MRMLLERDSSKRFHMKTDRRRHQLGDACLCIVSGGFLLFLYVDDKIARTTHKLEPRNPSIVRG